jgi:hypothetical protein
LGFLTGWSFTTHQDIFLAPLPGNEEEEAPTSTMSSHVNYAPSRHFSGAVAGEKVEDFCEGSFSYTHPLLFIVFLYFIYFYLHRFIKNPKKLESLVVVISLL